MQARRDEILAKKAKLAELKRQRELRQNQHAASRQSIGDGSELVQPTPSRADSRREIDSLISSLVDRPGSTAPGTPSGRSRPTSVISASQLSGERGEQFDPSPAPQTFSPAPQTAAQTLSFAPITVVNDEPSSPKPVQPKKPVYVTYNKGVQTSEPWGRSMSVGGSDSEDERPSSSKTSRSAKRLSRRERERVDEELRQNIRREIEDELKAARSAGLDGPIGQVNGKENFPARTLTTEELNAVTGSDDFLDFVERSTKVIERSLDERYDILADYALRSGHDLDDEEEGFGRAGGKKARRVRELAQFWDERWSKKRMISDLSFSSKFPELVCAAYTKNPSAPLDPDGLIQVWNLHMHDRPEYTFHAQSDILTAKFSPFHPNLIIGGAYSGQVLLWDTRAKSAPVQKTPLTGAGHTHPVYSVDIVGTQHANNIISCSTDGVVCGWTVDMLSQPQEYLELITPPPAKTEDMAPTCIAFPRSDPTYFLTGSEEGSIYPCHRYDRAGAKAGVDVRLSYRGHTAPVMSLDFHPERGPIDLGDLVLSSSLDWSVKLWKIRPPAATSTTAISSGAPHVEAPLFEFVREDLVYDARWSPVKSSVFALVDGAGSLEIWDVNVDTEVPVAKASPGDKTRATYLARSLNKVAWEPNEGRRVAVGGLDGVVSVFEVSPDLGGSDGVMKTEEFAGVKKWVSRLEAAAAGGGTQAAATAGAGAGAGMNGR